MEVTPSKLKIKEITRMKKTWIVLALAVALTFMFAAAAFADHSPTFYVEWNKASLFDSYAGQIGNLGNGSPHANYLEGTEKCAVCHSVHRAPVPGMQWNTNAADPAAYTFVAGKQYKRQEWESPLNATKANYTTQMLLKTDVADSCDYCHIATSVGGDQLYAGKAQYRTEGTGLAGAEWDAGFAHHNGCTGCHVVHGVGSNYGDPALWGQYGTFQGPIKSKVLKLRAKGSGAASGNRAYAWQEETVVIGSAGKVEAAALWPAWVTGAADDATVDPLNIPLFPSVADAIAGTNVRPDASAYDAQSGVFCTFCHVNYGYASEATVNPDHDRSLFQGPWSTLYSNTASSTLPGWTRISDTNGGMNSTWPGDGTTFKNHPNKAVTGTFAAAGKSASVPAAVAFANASTCVSCHNAGLNRPVDSQTGVFIESYPHFTPGYFHFVKSGARVGASMTNGPVELGLIPNVLSATNVAGLAAAQAWLEDPVNYEESTTVQDGQCLKCHINAAGTAGVGLTY